LDQTLPALTLKQLRAKNAFYGWHLKLIRNISSSEKANTDLG
jgi:hypothetical protein